MSMELIQRLSSGALNTVNDTLIGGGGGNIGPQIGLAPGQLGKIIELDDSELGPVTDTTMGTLYGGEFQYVRLAAAATAVVVGQIVFWDISVADNLFQVTTSEAGSTVGAQFRAGIVLNSDWDAGNYGYIQRLGPTYVKFASVLTGTAQIGGAVYCAAIGAGANNGFADIYDLSAVGVTFNDAGLLDNRYLGAAIDLPVASGLKLVNLNFRNLRG